MKDILLPYINKGIGINYEKPFKIESAILVAVNDNYFTIIDSENRYTHHFSWSSIVQIIENKDGIEVGGLFSHKDSFTIVIKVGHLVEYVMA